MAKKSSGNIETVMRAPKGTSSASWDGELYEVDKSGLVVVPTAAVEDLISHGFVVELK